MTIKVLATGYYDTPTYRVELIRKNTILKVRRTKIIFKHTYYVCENGNCGTVLIDDTNAQEV